MDRRTKYIEVEKGNATHLKIEVYYSKGGMNYFAGTNEARGIYLSVSPVTRGDRSESYIGFSGIKKCVKSMQRFSQKAFDDFQVSNEVEQFLINHVCQKNGIELKKV